MEKLIHIKNENEETKKNSYINKESNVQKTNTGDGKLQFKLKILIFYKVLISNLEVIMEYIGVLRNKGSNLPIKISIRI